MIFHDWNYIVFSVAAEALVGYSQQVDDWLHGTVCPTAASLPTSSSVDGLACVRAPQIVMQTYL